MKRYAWLLLFVLAITSCNNLVKRKTSETDSDKENVLNNADNDEEKTTRKKKTLSEETLKTNSDAKILNDIIVHQSGGLKVAQAYLSFEDGNLVPKSNTASLSEAVYLNLMIEDGWQVNEGEVSLDASEKIVTDQGQLVLNATNLFRSNPTVSAADASRINLKATITKTRSDIDYFVVNYRVWDKQGDGEVKGSYKLRIKNQEE